MKQELLSQGKLGEDQTWLLGRGCMFRRPLLLLVLLSPALLGAGSWYLWPRPFEPGRATSRELGAWLLQNDAAAAPPAFQAALYERCRRELLDTGSQMDWAELYEALKTVSAEQRAHWDQNVRWWCRRWWINEAQSYAAVPQEKRGAYLQGKMAHWQTHEFVALGKLRSAGEANPSAELSPALLAELSSEIESWIALAEPGERPSMQEFWSALRWQFLMQSPLWQQFRN
jgi:hypothetical protein